MMNLQPPAETLNSLNAVSITLDAIAPVIVIVALFATAAAALCLFFLCRNEARPVKRRRTQVPAQSAAVYSLSRERAFRRKSRAA
ncbi:MAG: hypothetical protein SF339_28045 [Blastocatellia bacterium]|nr:hypothetical protein [Blastocatellia bacterium]